ncbi:MAG: hypothetical protein KGD73_04400 [Candidatus Lokiarchaeota archaeon]|nr:hypothetical protein [Candidatus Lokiarchaeota archaeon]
MTEEIIVLRPACPKCGVSKVIPIPKSVFAQKTFGFIKIQVPQGACCEEHQFIVIADTKGRIIGYEAIDLSVSKEEEELPELEIKSEVKFPLQYLINKLGFNSVAGLLHAKLFKYDSFIIKSSETDISLEDLNDYYDYLIPEPYKNSIKIDSVDYDDQIFPNPGYFYSLVTNQKTKAFLFNPRKHIVQMPWRTNLYYETHIINFALERKDPKEQTKIISDSITRFINDSEFAKTILEGVKKITEKDFMKTLDEKLTLTTINKYRMALTKEFLRRRVSVDLLKKIKK